MNTADPIRSPEQIAQIKDYYHFVAPNERNYLLIVMGLNTALRISDILSLVWDNVYDFDKMQLRSHIRLIEKKTSKSTIIYLNDAVRDALKKYWSYLAHAKSRPQKSHFLFVSSQSPEHAICRSQAFRIIKNAAQYYHIDGTICCHSLRKTFGYHAWKTGAAPTVLMNIYNHSSYQITKRYLGIEQDDRDDVYRRVVL